MMMEFIWLMSTALFHLFHCVSQRVCKCYKDGTRACGAPLWERCALQSNQTPPNKLLLRISLGSDRRPQCQQPLAAGHGHMCRHTHIHAHTPTAGEDGEVMGEGHISLERRAHWGPEIAL